MESRRVGYWDGHLHHPAVAVGNPPVSSGSFPLVGIYNGHGGDSEIATAANVDFDMGASYYNAGNNPLHAWDLDRLANGTMPVVAYTTKNQGGGGPESFIAWPEIAQGLWDVWFINLATRLASYDTDLIFAFDHEAEVKRNRGEVPSSWTSQNYRDAFRRVVTVMRPLTPRVKYAFWVGGADTTKINEHYPGDDVVDMIGWDPYVHMGWAASTTATQRWSVFNNWLNGRSWGQGKSRGLFEWGYDSRHGETNGIAFMQSIPAAVKDLGLEWIILFNRDSGPNTNAKIIHPGVMQAYGEAMRAVQSGQS